MHPHESLVHQFYTAFSRGDYATMQSLYHPEATFHDPAFGQLNAQQTKAMWQMLLTGAKDLKVTFDQVSGDASAGRCTWQAWYTFSRTGRLVHNVVQAHFRFRDGLIIEHRDHFSLWRWSRQALGLSGWLLGWSPVVANKVNDTARRGLEKFMSAQ